MLVFVAKKSTVTKTADSLSIYTKIHSVYSLRINKSDGKFRRICTVPNTPKILSVVKQRRISVIAVGKQRYNILTLKFRLLRKTFGNYYIGSRRYAAAIALF